jgi:hypothetical protein
MEHYLRPSGASSRLQLPNNDKTGMRLQWMKSGSHNFQDNKLT